MKDLSEILVNSDQLKMLIGVGISDGLHHKLLGKKKYLESSSMESERYSLKALIATKYYPKIKSLHKKFDGKEPIALVANRIFENGLDAEIRDRIFNSKLCILRGNVCGQFYFLRQFLNDEQLAEIRINLKKVKHTTQLSLL